MALAISPMSQRRKTGFAPSSRPLDLGFKEKPKMQIADRKIGPDQPPLVIAEIGINHGGDLDVARHMVTLAAKARSVAIMPISSSRTGPGRSGMSASWSSDSLLIADPTIETDCSARLFVSLLSRTPPVATPGFQLST